MGGVLAHGQPACEPGPGSTQQDGGVPARDSRRMIFPRSTGLIGLSIPLRIKGVVLFVHNGFTLCVFLERSLHFVCAGFYLGPSSPWCKSRGRRYAPWADGATLGRSRNAAPSSPRFFLRRPEAARNPLGDGHFVPTAVLTLLPTVTALFLRSDRLGRRLCRSSEEIDPDRRPPHSAPSDRRSPPRFFLRTTGLPPRAARAFLRLYRYSNEHQVGNRRRET